MCNDRAPKKKKIIITMKNIFEAGKAHLDLMGQTDNPAVHTIAANEFRISVVLFRQTR